jgi:hypothetical protein
MRGCVPANMSAESSSTITSHSLPGYRRGAPSSAFPSPHIRMYFSSSEGSRSLRVSPHPSVFLGPWRSYLHRPPVACILRGPTRGRMAYVARSPLGEPPCASHGARYTYGLTGYEAIRLIHRPMKRTVPARSAVFSAVCNSERHEQTIVSQGKKNSFPRLKTEIWVGSLQRFCKLRLVIASLVASRSARGALGAAKS